MRVVEEDDLKSEFGRAEFERAPHERVCYPLTSPLQSRNYCFADQPEWQSIERDLSGRTAFSSAAYIRAGAAWRSKPEECALGSGGADALCLSMGLMFSQIETDLVLKTANNQQDDQRLAWG